MVETGGATVTDAAPSTSCATATIRMAMEGLTVTGGARGLPTAVIAMAATIGLEIGWPGSTTSVRIAAGMTPTLATASRL
jgi:hypothetical protein